MEIVMSEKRKTGGFSTGTRLFCGIGLTPIEQIKIGDRLVTRDAGIARVTTIAKKTIRNRFVEFKPYSMGEIGPATDLLLPADQLILVRDWRAREAFGVDRALVQASSLVDDMFIRMTQPMEQVVFQVSFASPHILYLEGIEVGSADAIKARGLLLHSLR
jgi:hypothetical protein